ncbi:disease resistance protein CHL1 isoform X1 [Arabidopsis lyrata subsp. lyrata]|uniref:disease resistance protein CHL1 isoform X1 n=2 Tax=Arabidopsis lyrata subsp. lyrata TaxID=81972 RepID=UPI000A29C44B|nr:disease resistance protein CHL1 isoform X1 [Arabidopsis lyrata subsp. lyrata]|eukprot:XP_020872952.1 disease resistance protein CHL1 isoform X1 [Arabidopsis lyrata subsp. lyrata]
MSSSPSSSASLLLIGTEMLGDEIRTNCSTDLRTLKALEESRVAIVMTSATKPCSVGFLEELLVILEFQQKGSLMVIPIFLKDYSFNVEEIYRQYPEKAPSWRIALTKLTNFAAEYPFSQNLAGMDQSDRLNQIVHDISLVVFYSASNDSNALVAMDRHMKVVYDLLALEVNKEVRTIGIWGSAGVGKTTLARYIYSEIFVNFRTNVFLDNVENMKDKLLKFEGEEDPTVIISSYDGHEITEARRKHRKVLLIADDVNNIKQGKWIIEYANWFAPGSRVILISQNKHLLVDAGVSHVYEVRSLRYDEALQVFSHFAFKQSYPPSDFEKLAVRAVHLAGFLPLGLRLLGSFLSGKGREEWVAALLKLKAKQGGNIMEVWKLMEPSDDKGQEEWETAADIVEGKELSQDKGQEEREVAAGKTEGKESSQ